MVVFACCCHEHGLSKTVVVKVCGNVDLTGELKTHMGIFVSPEMSVLLL